MLRQVTRSRLAYSLRAYSRRASGIAGLCAADPVVWRSAAPGLRWCSLAPAAYQGAGWRSACRVGQAGLLEPGADPAVVRQVEVLADLQGLLPGPTGGWLVTSGPAGVAEGSQQAGQPPAGQRGFPLVREGQCLPVAADRLGVLTEPGVHQTQRLPRDGPTREVASPRVHF
jgi:hypothetical protein